MPKWKSFNENLLRSVYDDFLTSSVGYIRTFLCLSILVYIVPVFTVSAVKKKGVEFERFAVSLHVRLNSTR